MANSFGASGIQPRQSDPPGPPAPFVPPLVSKENPQLVADHMRLRPEDRFRSADRPGASDNVRHPGGIPPQVTLGRLPPAAAEKLKHAPYPKCKYHKIAAPAGIIVQDPDEESAKCSALGWQDKPFPAEKLATPAERLQLLESLVQTLADQASGDETPEEVLARVIAERVDFAKKFASLSKGK